MPEGYSRPLHSLSVSHLNSVNDNMWVRLYSSIGLDLGVTSDEALVQEFYNLIGFFARFIQSFSCSLSTLAHHSYDESWLEILRLSISHCCTRRSKLDSDSSSLDALSMSALSMSDFFDLYSTITIEQAGNLLQIRTDYRRVYTTTCRLADGECRITILRKSHQHHRCTLCFE